MLEDFPSKYRKKNNSNSCIFLFFRIKVNNWEECVTQCCRFNRCNVAYWISSVCVHIECISDELCQPINGDSIDVNDEIFYLKVRSIRK